MKFYNYFEADISVRWSFKISDEILDFFNDIWYSSDGNCIYSNETFFLWKSIDYSDDNLNFLKNSGYSYIPLGVSLI